MAVVMLVVDDKFDFALVGYTKERNTDLVGKGLQENIDVEDLEGKANMKIRAMEMVEEFKTQRADKQVKRTLFTSDGKILTLAESLGLGHLQAWRVSDVKVPLSPRIVLRIHETMLLR
ncbi:hypothetical protein Tco_0438620 [Tanacetum coccineum]